MEVKSPNQLRAIGEFRLVKGLGQEIKNPRKLIGVNSLNKLKGIKNLNRSMYNYEPN